MANELRKRQNFLAGTITDNPLLIGATTINSANLAKVAGGVGAADHMAITLDPAGADGDPEIVYITAHTALGTVATIVRAQEGTVAREHAQGVVWSHSPTVRDIPQQPHFASGAGVSNALDDEFDVAMVAPAWVKVDPVGNVITAAQGRGALSLSIPGGDAAQLLHGFVKPIGAFTIGNTIETAASICTTNVGTPACGPIFADGTTHGSGIQATYQLWQSTGDMNYSDRSHTNWTASTGSNATGYGKAFPRKVFMRMQWSATNTFLSSHSGDGLSWSAPVSRTTTITPTYMGFFVSSGGAAAGFFAFTFDYFRVF